MSDNSDGDRMDPSKNDPPDLTGLKTYAKALKNARSKPKVQMTPMLNQYMKMKNNATSYNGNLIELTFARQHYSDSATPEFPSLEVVATYLFEILKVNQHDALELDHFSSRNKKRILLRDGVDIDKHRIYMPDTYKGYIINVEKISQTKTRILFKNVPIDCPEVELINLCNTYGKLEGGISNQFMNVPIENKGNIRMRTSNRVAYVVLHPGKLLKNFYWLGGLQYTSKDTKITAIHHGQTQQCANCLLTEEEGCPAMGLGKECKNMNTPRTPLAEYFKRLEEEDGFISLRTQAKRYTAQQRGQTEEPTDAEDNREDLDYEEEMEGLNNPTNSPLRSAYEKVMKAPSGSTEKQIPKVLNVATPVPSPVENVNVATPVPSPVENPTTVNEPINTEDTSIEETLDTNEDNDPTAKERLTEQCLNLILNTKDRTKVSKEHTTQFAESLAVFFKMKDGFQKLEDGTFLIEETSIFPSVTRVDLNTEQTAIFDRILDPMEPFWQRKFKIKVRINKKSKRPRNADSPKASPPPKNAKSDE